MKKNDLLNVNLARPDKNVIEYQINKTGMNILTSILLVFVIVIALILIVAGFTKKKYYIERKIVIDASVQKVFDYLKYLKNWDNFNERAVADTGKHNTFTGVDGTAGFIYAWNGNKKVGKGEKEIRLISEGKKIETEIRFEKPFVAIGHTNMMTDQISASQTEVTMSNASKIKYPLNILLLVVEKGIAKDMEKSLSVLKDILEK